MADNPLVSAIVIFLNAERFLQEAIDSILAQTYAHWELLLVDDGSSDGSTAMARQLAAQRPQQVRYLEHPGHANRGMSASRNLGISHSRGHYIAFLDADDVWLPQKLEEQVAILESHPEAGMLYGRTRYWYSWMSDGGDDARDFVPEHGIRAGMPLAPPTLLPLYLRGKAAVPCTCSLLVRRSVVHAVGGFEEAFTAIYEDQAFYAKMSLNTQIIAAPQTWDCYRQHPRSSTALIGGSGQDIPHRLFFLNWLERYLTEQGVRDRAVWQALQRERWRIQSPSWLPSGGRVQHGMRWLKKWALHFEERLLPPALSCRLWRGLT
jgi:glycosyltransferase involved in cell wall biosynthesis